MELSSTVAAALRRFDVDARIGEVRGEPAPGMYSVNAQDRTKLAAIDQRAIDGLVDELGARYDTEEGEVEGTLRLAQALEPEHRQPGLTPSEPEGSRRRGRDR